MKISDRELENRIRALERGSGAWFMVHFRNGGSSRLPAGDCIRLVRWSWDEVERFEAESSSGLLGDLLNGLLDAAAPA